MLFSVGCKILLENWMENSHNSTIFENARNMENEGGMAGVLHPSHLEESESDGVLAR